MRSDTLYLTKASAGTGKTYTLAAHYIALLMGGFSHKQILAVTFTNKATAEMKERIITYLHAIAVRPDLPDVRAFLSKVREVSAMRGLPELSDEDYAARARELVASVLSDFDDMRITTIDSFLQTLLTGLAQTLGQAAGYGVDLDLDHAVTEAVDEAISLDVADSAEVRDAVVGCLRSRLSSEEKWDLRPSLISMVKELYKESVQIVGDEILFTSSEHPEHSVILKDYRDRLAAWRTSESMQRLQEAYARIAPLAAPLAEGKGSRNYNAFFRRLKAVAAGIGTEFNPLGPGDFKRFSDPTALPLLSPDDCSLLLKCVGIINDELPRLSAAYTAGKVRGQYLTDLLLVGYVVERIRRNLRESNTILLAETANTLFRALRDHDAQFILMKAGIRYKHIMLDEFQDTSTLQWANFRPLIEEIVSQEQGTALIVGDVKQSIYRWRNGDFEIMRGLDSADSEPVLSAFVRDCHLVRNFRSRRAIIDFCMHSFHELAQKEADDVQKIYDEGFTPESDLQPFYKASNQGGYVSLRAFAPAEGQSTADARDALLTDMFARMEQLLAAGYSRSDMLILIRSRFEAQQVLKAFYALIDETGESGAYLYPHLRRAGKIVSGDSFRLDTSIAVNSVISGLKYVVRADRVALTYLSLNCPDADLGALKRLSCRLPLSDLIEQITRICLCPDGAYGGTDIAHLNCLRDKLRAYITRYGSDPEAFLQYWDDSMSSSAIPAAESDDVRIMTIHASKGLQAKCVFMPFVGWPMEPDTKKTSILWCRTPDVVPSASVRLPIRLSKDMLDAGFAADYERELLKYRIDQLNLLYVACTRAEDNLFVSVLRTSRNRGSAGNLLYDLYGADREWGELQMPEQQSERREGMPRPFDFTQAEPLYAAGPDDTLRPPYRYVSADTDIEFRQSLQARQLLLTPDSPESPASPDTPIRPPFPAVSPIGRAAGLPETPDSPASPASPDNRENVEFGNLCHAILEKIRTAADLGRTVEEFYLRGQIPSAKMRDRIFSLLDRLMHHPVAGEWFSGEWQLLREDTVLQLRPTGVVERRMDRVMIRGKEAVVLDYKFGMLHPEYFDQVREYMCIMQQMGYSPVRGYLWAGFTDKLVEVSYE